MHVHKRRKRSVHPNTGLSFEYCGSYPCMQRVGKQACELCLLSLARELPQVHQPKAWLSTPHPSSTPSRLPDQLNTFNRRRIYKMASTTTITNAAELATLLRDPKLVLVNCTLNSHLQPAPSLTQTPQFTAHPRPSFPTSQPSPPPPKSPTESATQNAMSPPTPGPNSNTRSHGSPPPLTPPATTANNFQ